MSASMPGSSRRAQSCTGRTTSAVSFFKSPYLNCDLSNPVILQGTTATWLTKNLHSEFREPMGR